RILPEGEVCDIWIADGRISREPVGGSETIASGGWILPALVDAHVHLGIAEIGGPLDFEVLRNDLRHLTHSGVGAARILGSPERLPAHRSEEHTSELQSRFDLVCRLLLEK